MRTSVLFEYTLMNDNDLMKEEARLETFLTVRHYLRKYIRTCAYGGRGILNMTQHAITCAYMIGLHIYFVYMHVMCCTDAWYDVLMLLYCGTFVVYPYEPSNEQQLCVCIWDFFSLVFIFALSQLFALIVDILVQVQYAIQVHSYVCLFSHITT